MATLTTFDGIKMKNSGIPTKSTIASSSISEPQDLVEIARVSGAHGVRGWIRIHAYSDDSTILAEVKDWWLKKAPHPLTDKTSQATPVRARWAREHGAAWLASLEGLDDRDEALALKGSTIWISRASFPKADDDEFYWTDLIGLDVYSTEAMNAPLDAQGHPPAAARFGVVHDMIDSPAHSLMSVQRQHQDDSQAWVETLTAKGKPVFSLIPFVAAHVVDIDLEAGRIWVDWPMDF